MALRGARSDARVAPLLDKLVRLEVHGGGRSPARGRPPPRRRRSGTCAARRARGWPRAWTPRCAACRTCAGRGLDDLPSVGAKAAQLAELMRVESADPACAGPVPVPPIAFAIPVVHSLEHFEASGAAALLAQLAGAARVRRRPARARPGAGRGARGHPRPPGGRRRCWRRWRPGARALFGTRALPPALQQQHRGPARLQRRRPVHVGQRRAGRSRAPAGGRPARGVGQPVVPTGPTTSASWPTSTRAQVAMGVLIHEAYAGRRAGQRRGGQPRRQEPPARRHPLPQRPGRRGQRHQPGARAWSASRSPTPGGSRRRSSDLSRSSLRAPRCCAPAEIERISCLMRAVHQHFQARLDPERRNRWFTMESEFKLVGQGGR